MNGLNKRLFQHFNVRQRIQAPITVQRWIQDGIRVPFKDECAPTSFVVPPYKLNKKEYEFVSTELKELQAIGAIKQVVDQPWCVSPIKCVPKKGGKYH